MAALDEKRGWMLMQDFGGDELDSEADASAVAEAVRTYAELQLSWVGRGDELLELGCPDRGLDVLRAQIDPLLGEPELLLPDHPDGLGPAELEAVPALAERLHAACERLQADGLPATLEHGDLHAGNVRKVEVGFLFFDWSDACLSVPFFGLVPFLEFHDEPLEPTLRETLRAAYLTPWAARLGSEPRRGVRAGAVRRPVPPGGQLPPDHEGDRAAGALGVGARLSVLCQEAARTHALTRRRPLLLSDR